MLDCMLCILIFVFECVLGLVLSFAMTAAVAFGAMSYAGGTPFIYTSDDCIDGHCGRPITCRYQGLEGVKTVVLPDEYKCPVFKIIPWGQAAFYDPRPAPPDHANLTCPHVGNPPLGRIEDTDRGVVPVRPSGNTGPPYKVQRHKLR